MDEKQAMKLIQQLRHDWMNDLQLILGNLQLGKQDKAVEKIYSIMEKAGQNRALDQLQLPKTTIFLHLLNAEYTHFQWEWHVEVDALKGDTYPDDDQLKLQLTEIYEIIQPHVIDFEVYHAKLSFLMKEEQWTYQLTIEEVLDNTDYLVENLKRLPYMESVTTRDHLQLTWR